jgi:hypothetical protein
MSSIGVSVRARRSSAATSACARICLSKSVSNLLFKTCWIMLVDTFLSEGGWVPNSNQTHTFQEVETAKITIGESSADPQPFPFVLFHF